VVRETGPYFADQRAGNFDATVDFTADFTDEPDIQLVKFLSADRNPINNAGYVDRVLDQLYTQQSRTRDPQKRMQIVRQFEKRALDEKAYQVYVFWWHRIIPHWAKLKGYKIGPSHYLEELQDVWLSE
jgi:peptide/nickel transport system substrate-binding protein